MTWLRALEWSPQDVVIVFGGQQDIKDIAGVPVIKQQQLVIPRGHPSYTELEELYDAACDVVRDVLEDWTQADVWDPEQDHEDQDQDEEDEAMGDG